MPRTASEHEEAIRLVAENMPGLVWGTRADGSTDFYGKRMLAWIGKEHEPIGEWGWIDLVHPADRAGATALWKHAFEQGELYEAEYRLRRHDGVYRWVRASAQALRNDEGRIIRWLGTLVDVHERHEAEELFRRREGDLRRATEELARVLEATPAAIWIARDASCDTILGNSAAHSILRVAPASNLSKSGVPEELSHFKVLHQGTEVPASQLPVQRAARGEAILGYEEELVFDDGSRRVLYGNAVPLRDGSGTPSGAVAAFVDVTALREATEAEQRARAEAEDANRAKDAFIAMVSHELRTPLNAILGWSQLLLSRASDPEATRRAAATIERNARLQARLIDDLLDAARIATNKVELETSALDLAAVATAAVESLRPSADAKRITIEVTPPARPVHVMGDRSRLQQVVWNLLSNAVKFTPASGRIIVEVEREGPRARVRVTDSGVGIGNAFLPQVFEPFRQADASASRRHGGVGLGLSIVRRLVELHGGTVSASSPGEGLGATFAIELPAIDASIAPPASAVPRHELAGVRALVVDDEPDARDLVLALLSDHGATVRTAASAAEAFEALRTWRPDVLVSDVGMPGEDGLGLLQRVRALGPDVGGATPAVGLSAYATKPDRDRAIASGFDRYETKPVDGARLVGAIASLVQANGSIASAAKSSTR